ncbi:ABC transporter ATP-binding protein/permease [Laribacter hongkongensis]|uniref:ABCB family ABC transporter ATP-binding protein/permease n=1 Tax=Laribacter hongkongensis TaxID=168471 RepID=UPI001EFE739C|nr:ABC transporter ATP-binding protein/permease [Laribacter hongkongensis]MCG8997303.1 ABC transporter ATP-binding protein/permease [Laribacter hongkongensis]MCG9003238.1 ABC transporter ATP-binding protein/permease [Laribacter hongkongensis]MCG9013365.1 ABC transporter ATP-binding protein/permease [Laribacter hongkongensis]MCG9018875.1 ABC transporter ATP-binding protein/permease [Laribacter hongkongensis]MCG9027505.1 ABC transporter ATP-binding protein/permease [Laribacter hongkongensis]
MRFTHSGPAPTNRNDLQTLKTLVPYLLEFKWRVALALSCLVAAKLANVSVPVFLKDVVDQLSGPHAVLALPMGLIAAYGLARLSTSVFGELRDAIFAKVTQRAIRRIAMQVFAHLQRLSLRFHLERQTGGMSRDIERGTKGIGFLLNFTLFNILPTLLEIALVAGILLWRYDWYFAVVTIGTIVAYITFTLTVTEWRMVFRRSMNDLDSKANSKAIDALLNYETVKYFGNERYEIQRYDGNLASWEDSAVKNQTSLNFLNAGQGVIIAAGVTLLMGLAADGVVKGTMSIGDLVLVNAYLIQLYAPLNFLGFVYREIKHSLADMERMFTLLDVGEEVADRPDAVTLDSRSVAIRFEHVDFGYDSKRQILHDVSFEIPAGHTVAVVGSSGAGKSTLSRLLFRFYDVNGGRISLNGRDLRDYSQASLRAHIGIVPQDTVLFNDSIYYNIAYGRPDASREEVIEAARAARIHEFVERLPDGYDTRVGERGLKLSGGEKQRVAIARTLLKNPPIMVFDEATSALDSETEKGIQSELTVISQDRTTLIIAHRLSTIVDADEIVVMEQGRIVERGNFRSLLEADGRFADMWRLQQQEEAAS